MFAWYERDDVQNQLVLFGRAIQGRAPYQVVIESDPEKCRSGYCSFDAQRITVNPTFFSAPAKEQFLLTKALLVHEAGHRRYTTFEILPDTIRAVLNILEDERIERRMYEEFAGVRWLIRKLAQRFYEEADSIDETSNSPNEVVFYFLQLRWAERISKPIKGALSPQNQVLWEKVRPLVCEAWQAETTETVNRNARKIVEILGMGQKSTSLTAINNTRKESYEAEIAYPLVWRQTTNGQ